MKLKAGKSEYRIEDMGQIYRAQVTTPKGVKPMRVCSVHDIALSRNDYGDDAMGTPSLIALDLFESGKHKLLFFPAPVVDMDAEVEYFPPRKVL